MAVTYDVVTGYAIARDSAIQGYFTHFSDAVRAAKDGDHINMICGQGRTGLHTYSCKHPGCPGVIPPFPEALCGECRSN